ncbi:MAG TPA: hypothetical protein VGN61_05495 [Verrucomicrobiae bacterium]
MPTTARGWAENANGNGAAEGMDGVANMRARMGKLGGQFKVNTGNGQGTVVRLDLPLN